MQIKHRSLGIGLLTFVFLFSGCGNKALPDVTQADPIPTVSNFQHIPSDISSTFAVDDKTLVVNADVIFAEKIPASKVVLLPVSEEITKIAEDFSLTQTQAAVDGSTVYYQNDSDGNTVRTLKVNSNGCVNYLDIANDINPPKSIDADHVFDPYYITSTMPSGINVSAAKAAEDVAALMESYTCFSFIPWNVCAYEAMDENDTGAYYIQLVPAYNGIPISMHSNVQDLALWVNAKYSNTGIFSFQGTFVFTHEKSEELTSFVTPDHVVESLGSNFHLLAQGDKITIDRISLQYYAEQDSNGTCILKPVWVLEGTEYMSEKITGYAPITERFTALYWAEDGSLLDMFSGSSGTATVS